MRLAGVAALPLRGLSERLDVRHTAATLILRCGGAAGASKDGGCVLGAECAANASRVASLPPQHEGGGCGCSAPSKGRSQPLTPPVLPGISPSGGEIGKRHAPRSNRSRQKEVTGRYASPVHNTQDGQQAHPQPISPPEGEMPGRAEGGKPHPKPSNNKNIQTKSTPYPKSATPRKKISRKISFTASQPQRQWPRSALGYTARRCGEAGPALMGERLRNLLTIGVEQQSPRRQREERDTVSDRPVSFSRCPKGLTAAGCTDSSSSSGRTRPWGERRKSGGTQEHAAPAPHRCETARTDRKAFAAAIMDAASPCEKRIDPPAPWIIGAGANRRQVQPNWQGASSARKQHHPDGKGQALKNVRPVLRQGFAFAIRVLPAVASGLLFGQKSRTGRCEVPFIDYPTRQLTAPRPNTHGRKW